MHHRVVQIGAATVEIQGIDCMQALVMAHAPCADIIEAAGNGQE